MREKETDVKRGREAERRMKWMMIEKRMAGEKRGKSNREVEDKCKQCSHVLNDKVIEAFREASRGQIIYTVVCACACLCVFLTNYASQVYVHMCVQAHTYAHTLACVSCC